MAQASLAWESAVEQPRFAAVLEDDIQELLECVGFNKHILAQVCPIDEIHGSALRVLQGLPLVGREIVKHGEKRSTKMAHAPNRLASSVLPCLGQLE